MKEVACSNARFVLVKEDEKRWLIECAGKTLDQLN
jgi:hypothetical protein